MKHSSLIVISFICAVAFLFLKPFQDPSTSASLSHSGIFSVGAMSEVKDYVETFIEEDVAPSDILVALDIDMTLTQPSQPEGQYPAILKHRDIYKGLSKEYRKEVFELASMYAVSEDSQSLVEKDTPSIIKDIQNKGVKTIAFTAAHAGRVGDHERFEVQRYDMLKDFGINFENTFEKKKIVFTSMPLNRGEHPVFYHGILCSNGENGSPTKGSVMGAFLREMEFSPKVIILVDDKKKNLESLEEGLKKDFPMALLIGLEYKEAMKGETAVSEAQFTAYWKGLAERAKNFIASRADEPVANKSSKL